MHHFGVAGQRCRSDPVGLVAHPVQHIAGSVDDAAGGGIRNCLQDNKIAEPLQQVDGEAAGLVPGVDHRLDGTEQSGGIPGGQGVHRIVDQGDIGDTQQCQRALVVHPLAVRTGE